MCYFTARPSNFLQINEDPKDFLGVFVVEHPMASCAEYWNFARLFMELLRFTHLKVIA